MKQKKKIVVFGILLISLLNGCTAKQNEEIIVEEAQPEVEQTETITQYTYLEEDTNDSWDEVTASINLNSLSVEGSGVVINGKTVTITQAGTYVLEGVLEEGQVVVDTTNEALVRIVLNGVTISNSTTSPIYSKQARKTVLILAEGSLNTVRDGSSYLLQTSEAADAAIYVQDDLSITGLGELVIEANYKDGITSKDILVITDGVLEVTAVNNGIKGRDGIAITSASIAITSGNDGIKANNDTDSTKGFIQIDGGEISIQASGDGIQAETSLVISNGTIQITTSGDANVDSVKGMKANTIQLDSGAFLINSEDDAIHSNGTIVVNGGEYTITTKDDGIRADETVTITDGTIIILESYEGIEASNVIIQDGIIEITSSDDGINAGGGSNQNQAAGEPPNNQQDQFSSGNYTITINGGNITVNAGGDGIDSNGAVTITGGSIEIQGPTNSGNGILDGDGGVTIDGGIFVGVGSLGMLQTPENTSKQNSIVVGFGSTQRVGTVVSIVTSSAKEILTITAEKEFQCAMFSSNELISGETYQIYVNGNYVAKISISQVVSTIMDDGSTTINFGMGGKR